VIQMTYTLNPIGHVARTESTAKIVVDPEFRQGLVHLNEFSHAIILWWIHERDNPGDRHRLLANPPRGKGTEPSGVFACRSPFRPNPIGHSVVGLVSVDTAQGLVVLDQIDARDGTPVLDIKPYLPSSDKVDDVEVAPWFANLERRYSD
jgi:tRNA-Thr(GGU) m(6)t(6)A37 methyltransferase TsaA